MKRKYSISLHNTIYDMAHRRAVEQAAGKVSLEEAEACAQEYLLPGEHLCVWSDEDNETPVARYGCDDNGQIFPMHV